MLSLFRASGEGLRHELDSDSQTVDSGSGSGNESFSVLWLVYMAVKVGRIARS